MTWLRSNWLKGLALPVLLTTLRACWVWTWLELARTGLSPSAPSPLMPLSALILLPLTSLFMARVLLSDRLSLTTARLIEAVAGMAAIVLLLWWRFYSSQYAPWNTQWLHDLGHSLTSWETEFPAPVILVPFLIYFWLRGVLDGRGQLYREDVWGAFGAGFVGLAIVGVISLTGGRGLPQGVYEAAFLFFGTGLAAIAIASLETTRNIAERRGDDQLTFNRYWFISVASIIVVLLLAGFILSALITPQAVARMMRWTTGILDIVGLLLYYLLLVFAYVVFLFIGPLISLLQRLLAGSGSEERTPIEMPDFQKQLEDMPKGEAALPPAVAHLLPWLGLVAAIFIIGLIFAVALRRLYGGKDDEEIETRESILSRSLLLDQLAGLGRRFRRSRPPVVNPFLSLDGEHQTRRIIREAYQALLAATRTLSRAHRRDQTPTEYRDILRKAWPQEETALDTLTQAYLKARYAAQLPSTDDAASARQAWNHMQPAIMPEESRTPKRRRGTP